VADLPRIQPARRLPIALAVVAYAIGFVGAFVLVQGDLDPKCSEEGLCLWTSGAWKFWFTMPLVPAFLALFGARRLLNGPRVTREELMLFFAAPSEPRAAAGTGSGATVGALLAALAQLGYSLRAFALDGALRPAGEAAGGEPLVSGQFVFKEKSVTARLAYLRLVLSPARSKGTGLLEIADTSAGVYAELASFAMQVLSSMLPELRFRRLVSALPPEPAAVMAPPPRPIRLVPRS
jgi:hypothetical protein